MRRLSGWLLVALLIATAACSKTAVAPKAATAYNKSGARSISKGDSYALKGCRKKALLHYFKAVEFFTLSDNQKFLATAYNNIGALYLDEKKPDEALHYFKSARKLHLFLRTEKEEARALTNTASALLLKGALAEAAHALEEAEKIQGPSSSTRLARAHLCLKMNEPQKAIDALGTPKTFEKTAPATTSAASYTLGLGLKALEKHSLALAAFEKALAIDTQRGAFSLMAKDMREIAFCLKKIEKNSRALWYAGRAFSLFTLANDAAGQQELELFMQELSGTSVKENAPVIDHFAKRWRNGKALASPCDWP